MSEPDLREQVLAAALRDLRSFEKRYAEVAELSGVFEAINKARKKIGKQANLAA